MKKDNVKIDCAQLKDLDPLAFEVLRFLQLLTMTQGLEADSMLSSIMRVMYVCKLLTSVPDETSAVELTIHRHRAQTQFTMREKASKKVIYTIYETLVFDTN